MKNVVSHTLVALAGLVWGAIAINAFGNWHITEKERTEAFNEGVSHGTCLAIKGRVSAEEMDKCWEMKDD